MKDGKELLLKILENYDELEKEPSLFECFYQLTPSFNRVEISINKKPAKLMEEIYDISSDELLEIFSPVADAIYKVADDLTNLIVERADGALEVRKVKRTSKGFKEVN